MHSILSKFRLEATLHSLLGVVLGAKHLFKDFLKKTISKQSRRKIANIVGSDYHSSTEIRHPARLFCVVDLLPD